MIFSFYVLRFKTELKLFTPFFSKYKKHNLLNWPPNFSVAIDFSRSGNSSLTEVQAPDPRPHFVLERYPASEYLSSVRECRPPHTLPFVEIIKEMMPLFADVVGDYSL